jgi:hypothetical protein
MRVLFADDTIGSERGKVEVVVVDLSCIVKYWTRRSSTDDLFERECLIWSPCRESIEIVDIGLEMLAMVELEGLL